MAKRKRRPYPIVYSEVDAFFRLDNQNALYLSVNGDAVADSIRNIVKTVPGERVNNPSFGCDLLRYLFEPLDERTAEMIASEIHYKIEMEEPRVKIVRVTVTPDYDAQSYVVSVNFYIKQVPNQTHRVELTLSGIFS